MPPTSAEAAAPPGLSPAKVAKSAEAARGGLASHFSGKVVRRSGLVLSNRALLLVESRLDNYLGATHACMF
jgi:hypothetical protein